MDDHNFFGTRELAIIGTAVIAAGLIFAFRTPLSQTNAVSSEAREALAGCRTSQFSKEICYATYFRNLTTATDWHHAFDVLHALQKIDVAANGCHLIAHGISRSETQKDPSKWREIMNNAPQECSYGAAHGALEVHAASFADGKLPVSEIETACDNPDTHNCTHILGHLLLVMNDRDIAQSLSQCESLPHDTNGQFECLTGVFMEEITANNLVEHGLADESALNWPARFPELENLCLAQTGVHSVACWKEITHVATVAYNANPQQTFAFCETAPGEVETRECIDHAVGILAGMNNFDFSRTGAICEAKASDPSFTERCYSMLVNSTLSTLPAAVPEAKRFCASIQSTYRPACLAAIENVHRLTGD